MTTERMFPVLMNYDERRRPPGCPRSVPWSLLAPHESQALRNHDQSLEKLARRGGLSMCEMVAIIEHRRWRGMTADEQMTSLRRHLAEHAASSAPPAAPQDAPGRLEPHDWISQHAPGVEQRTFCSRCGADLADEEADRWCKPTRAARGETGTPAAPQGSPLPGQKTP